MTIIPWYGRLALLLALSVALIGFGWVKGAHHVRSEWDAATVATERAQSQAITDRLASNARVADKQTAANAAITQEKNHEISILTARVNAASRLRVGPAICGGPAAPTEAPSTSSGDGPDSPGRLVREDIDRDFKALIVAVETDLATGRACQAFVIANGLAP